jgi:uncharacterized protein YbjT (DUF2867 family)
VARVLIVGGGCGGRQLAAELVGSGHAVRVTTRDPSRGPEILATGAEPYVGDPDRVGTLVAALDGVAIVVWALARATGQPDAVSALHRDRLRAFLEKTVDSTVRGVVYDALGTVPGEDILGGLFELRRAQEIWNIPILAFASERDEPEAWVAQAKDAVESMLEPTGPPETAG